MPPNLSDPVRRALAAISSGRSVIVRAEQIDEAELRELDWLTRDVLRESALAVRWEVDADVYWTLTPLGAEIMGLEIEERSEGRPAWAKIEPGRRPRPIRLRGRPGERRLAREDLVRAPASKAPDPAEEARVAECAELLRRFELTVESDPEGAIELLRLADTIVAGVSEAMKERYLWDVVENRPSTIMGRLIRRDGRIGPGRTG